MGTSPCDNFIGYTYLHLFGAGLLSVVAAHLDLVKKSGLKTDGLLAELVIFGLSIVFLFLTIIQRPGPYKYFTAGMFVILVGTALRATVDRFGAKRILTDVLLTVSSIFLAMTLLGFYDRQNVLGFGPYLFVALLGLVLGRAGVGIAMFVGAPEEKVTGWNWVLSVGATLVFSLYLAFDTQMLKEMAKECDGKPDYIDGALSLYTDIVGLFVNLEDLKEGIVD